MVEDQCREIRAESNYHVQDTVMDRQRDDIRFKKGYSQDNVADGHDVLRCYTSLKYIAKNVKPTYRKQAINKVVHGNLAYLPPGIMRLLTLSERIASMQFPRTFAARNENKIELRGDTCDFPIRNR